MVSMGEWWPRREAGLPPGQRLLDEMPRFSDKPLLRAPTIPPHPMLEVTVNGDRAACVPVRSIAEDPSAGAHDHDFSCVTGWSVKDLRWVGVGLRRLLEAHLDVEALPAFARVVGHDKVFAVFGIEDLLEPSTLLATHLNGRPLDARHGAPLRLVAPELYGYKNIKHVRAIEFLDDRPPSGFGAKEHPRARIAHKERHSWLPNWMIALPYRLMIAPTAYLAERTLRSQ